MFLRQVLHIRTFFFPRISKQIYGFLECAAETARGPSLRALEVKSVFYVGYPELISLLIHVLTAWQRGPPGSEIILHSESSQMLRPLTIFLAQVSLSMTRALNLHKLFCMRASATKNVNSTKTSFCCTKLVEQPAPTAPEPILR